MSMIENRSASESHNQDRIGDYRHRLLLSGSFAKYLMLTRLAQETRSDTPVGAVSNRTDTLYLTI